MQPKSSTNSTVNREIAALVLRLLQHFWTAADPPEMRQAQMEDWIEDLREFGAELVADACREWRRRDDARRPTPGQIRALCIAAQREQREHLAAIAGPDSLDDYARDLGYANNAERVSDIRRCEAEREAAYAKAQQVRDEIGWTKEAAE